MSKTMDTIMELVKDLGKRELLELKEEVTEAYLKQADVFEKFELLTDIDSYVSFAPPILQEYMKYLEPNRYSTVTYSDVLNNDSWRDERSYTTEEIMEEAIDYGILGCKYDW